MKKKLTTLLITTVFAFAGIFVYADELDDDFDAIFEEDNDIETPLVTTKKENDSEKKEIITFSGKLASDLGYAYVYNPLPDEKIHTSGFVFTLSNDLFINARPSDKFNVKADINTTFANEFTLDVKELYFTYNPFAYLYITAGKKATTWGYVKLMKEIPHCDQLNTNILNDAGSKLSIQFVAPWSTGSASFIALYNMSNGTSFNKDKPLDPMKLSFAAAIEQTIVHTNVNLFMRIYEGRNIETKTLESGYINPVIGLEVKRTIFNIDFYAQNLLRIQDEYNEERTSDFEKEVLTVGFYKKWTLNPCTIGANVEYQYQHEFADSFNIHKTALDFGIENFGPSNGFKTGIEWNQDYTSKTGDATLALQISKLIPYVTIKSAVKFEYDDVQLNKITSGITLSLSCTY